MKTIIITILITFSLHSQKKSDTQIIVQNITDKDNFISNLIDFENYVQSEKYGVLTTELRNTSTKPNWSFQYQYKITLKDSTAIIKPFWTSGIGLNLNGITADAQINKWHWHKNKKSNINGIIANETITMLHKAGYTDIIFK